MAKNEFNPFFEYLDLCSRELKDTFECRNSALDAKIEDVYLDTLLDLDDIYRIDVSFDIVKRMFILQNLITERFCNGRGFLPMKEMVKLLSRELRAKIIESDKRAKLVLETDGSIKSITMMLGDEAVLGIETFDEDRFTNDLMVSCNRVKNVRPVTSARVISPNYIFGDNGVYINTGDESFLDTFKRTNTEEFDSTLELHYWYIDYSRPEERVLVDRVHGLKDTITDTGEVKLGSFHAPMLNGIILGALKHSDEQILNFINRSSTNDENIDKVYRKVNE
ncbi:MAG: hypothetical protein PUA97_01310 [bacterium]|nr:hypothetical protein [bacterium]